MMEEDGKIPDWRSTSETCSRGLRGCAMIFASSSDFRKYKRLRGDFVACQLPFLAFTRFFAWIDFQGWPLGSF